MAGISCRGLRSFCCPSTASPSGSVAAVEAGREMLEAVVLEKVKGEVEGRKGVEDETEASGVESEEDG